MEQGFPEVGSTYGYYHSSVHCTLSTENVLSILVVIVAGSLFLKLHLNLIKIKINVKN